jgi:hypothetical protein
LLDISQNRLVGLPDELSRLGNLKELHANENFLPTVPISALRGMTALTTIYLNFNCWCEDGAKQPFKITSPLMPILHPGLVLLDIRQPIDTAPQEEVAEERFKWDPVSLFHLARAVIAVADRRPRPVVLFST